MSDGDRRARRLVALALALATLLAALGARRLEVAKDLAALFPESPASAALARYVRTFGGGDLAVVLVEGDAPDAVERAADDAAAAFAALPDVAGARTRAPSADDRLPDPSRAWEGAPPTRRARLAEAVGPGLRERVHTLRGLLLAPGAAAAADALAADPLRLTELAFAEDPSARGDAGGPGPGERFVAADGRTAAVLVLPRAAAFEPDSARRFVDAADGALAALRAEHPEVRFGLGGGHAIARETEALLRRDLVTSSVVSVLLSTLPFVLLFRRARALAALLPPLALGALWTAGVAGFAYDALGAIATAFASVVVGVGVDSGVHLYARLLDERRAGHAPREAAARARRACARPVLVAAGAAALAFASLATSSVAGVRQLGVLSGVGELATAVAILLVLPEIAAHLERGAPPPALVSRARAPRGLLRAGVVGVAAASVALAPWLARPVTDDPLGARQVDVPARRALERAQEILGGTGGQWIVLTEGATLDEARARADRVFERAEALVAEGSARRVDAAARWEPADATKPARWAARDAALGDEAEARLRAALEAEGLDPEAFAPLDAALGRRARAAAPDGSSTTPGAPADGTSGWLAARHVRADAHGALVVTWVLPAEGHARDRAAMRALEDAAEGTVVTGFPELDEALRDALARDLPRALAVAALGALLALGASLRKPRLVACALAALAVELAWLFLATKVLGVPWHVFDALVVPALLGITLDEVLFYLAAVERHAGDPDAALRHEAPLVTITALATAGGFAALLVCRFAPLAHVGAVGALGSSFGLLAARIVVPALAGASIRDARGGT